MNHRTNKRALITIVTLALIFVIGLSFIAYRSSQTKLSIQPSVPSDIALYKPTVDENADLSKEKPVYVSVMGIFDTRVSPGTYTYVVAPRNKTYETQISPLDVTGKSMKLKVTLVLKQNRLAELSSLQRPLIEQKLRETYASTLKNFTVADVKAFGDGSWYGVRLNPLAGEVDTYISIVRITGKNNVEIAAPPSLTLAAPIYPSIPKEVIIGTNLMIKDLY
ncbi:MAG: hypothetical protein QFB86_02810 [Patescibacteria group bacterium]|nr:hypothetical protein [Patescibacteria group bacterium]